jgi:hypothetical protein
MVERLGLSEAEVEVLKAQEQAGKLPAGIKKLEDFLSAVVREHQSQEFGHLVNELLNAKNKPRQTPEDVDGFLDKLRGFVETI